jgi:hypothetical protein
LSGGNVAGDTGDIVLKLKTTDPIPAQADPTRI